MLDNLLSQIAVFGRIQFVDPAAEHGDRIAPGFKNGAVGGGIDPTGHAAHDGKSRPG